jgi:hypothetical protein
MSLQLPFNACPSIGKIMTVREREQQRLLEDQRVRLVAQAVTMTFSPGP